MESYREYQVANEFVLELRLSTPDAVFGVIYLVRNNVYHEKGVVMAYRELADAEMHNDHWRAECYVSQRCYSSELHDGIGRRLLSSTACKEPMLVNLCFGERTDGRFRTYGDVFQELD